MEISKRVEKFIKEHTKNCSNKSLREGNYYKWLTPTQARKAVEIAKEEVIEKAVLWMKRKSAIRYHLSEELIEDFKEAMRKEK